MTRWSPEEMTRFARLAELTAVLIEPAKSLPAPAAIEGFADLIGVAARAAGVGEAEVAGAVAQLPAQLDAESVRRFSVDSPAAFETLSVICAGAYTMAPAVLESLGFPRDRQNPAGPMDAADEYETGILEPVVNSGRTFRDPRQLNPGEGRGGAR
jgi:hypothetical protein